MVFRSERIKLELTTYELIRHSIFGQHSNSAYKYIVIGLDSFSGDRCLINVRYKIFYFGFYGKSIESETFLLASLCVRFIWLFSEWRMQSRRVYRVSLKWYAFSFSMPS